ncbi:molybdenum ABC transporter ATP-binding protein [Beijerinckia indica]|uniref:Molybdate ABC transporter, ATPase subunit n=1 Tax=Beijerinckia indica subsp. indica (strain ATCC 9039 / DSM 1715 / NCIMB 8712) TaxID=395963 RepID=B2IHB3_BEII9|nr:molybdenum ABC transporter ATP-binding protein [Beijerinckia indica]ACB95898.1 molybdate ABC transporter, ATPase subunit [Beijerinckia indica subsp. indica ATCC 9039]
MIDVDVTLKVGSFTLAVTFRNGHGVTALFGQSGSGKSVTLSLIAGLKRPDKGHIVIDGHTLVDTEKGIFVPSYRRRIGVVFQDSYLFPHFSVRQNLLFGRWFAPKNDRKIDFDAVVETLGISRLLDRQPQRLSGGERQRVAIGRALLSCPHLLLFDEPLAALDQNRKLEILPLIEKLRDEFHIPMVYVSHAMEEVVRLASCIVLLEGGQVKAIGNAEEIFGRAATQLSISRLERSSILMMEVGPRDGTYDLTPLNHPSGRIWLISYNGKVGEKVRVLVNATDVAVSLVKPNSLSMQNVLQGTVSGFYTEGPAVMVEIVLLGDGKIFAMISRRAFEDLRLEAGTQVFALFKSTALDENQAALVYPNIV